jgi:hypothetical protein
MSLHRSMASRVSDRLSRSRRSFSDMPAASPLPHHRILVVIDEYTRECLALRVARRLGSLQVIETLADVMLVHGVAEAVIGTVAPSLLLVDSK